VKVESKVNYTVVGIFVVGLSIAMVIVFLWLSSLRNEKSYKTYLLYVNENVTGLTVQSPVRYNGVPVGFVKSIELDPHNAQLVKIILRIEVGTPITTSTVAVLQMQGITGVMYVGLKTTSVDSPLLQPEPGEKYAIIPTRPSFLVQISEVLPEVTRSIKKIGDSVNKLLNEKNQKAIADTLENLRKVTKTLGDNSKNLDESMKFLRTTLKNTAQASVNLPDAISNFRDAANQAKATFAGGTVVMRNFSTQIMPEAQQAVQNLSHAAQSVHQLTDQLEQNPSMLIRGKAPAPKGPGE
jgi:phospholipid/cholesterol/gamma-HCH transport system substrate-binding protein